MAKAVQKIKLSPSRDIPFNKLVLAQSNVRRTKAGISVEDLAEDIGRRGLLQSLNVRPILDADGQETDMWEVPAGGRRYRALELLVKQKRLAKTAPIPCVVVGAGGEISAEEDSLAENVHRVALHPLDQFRAFQTLREQREGAGKSRASDAPAASYATVKSRCLSRPPRAFRLCETLCP
jgi:ParB family chromosome partitioning protein